MNDFAEQAASWMHELAQDALGVQVHGSEPMHGGGSSRVFRRMNTSGGSMVGSAGQDLAEVRAFLAYTAHFAARGIPVPRILSADPERGLYLMDDLGGHTLADKLRQWRAEPDNHPVILNALHGVVRWLAAIQVRGGEGLDVTLCTEGPAMTAGVYRADLEVFFRHLSPHIAAGLTPDDWVRSDLDRLVEHLERLPTQHFCYRDFQARNIMWHRRPLPGPGNAQAPIPLETEGPVFLDYQSGRRGPLAYDLASLLYSPDSGLDDHERQLLIHAYLAALDGEGVHLDHGEFLEGFYPIVLIRRLQALGAYVRIGTDGGKPEYLEKIAPALDTLQGLLG
ncbi:MAG: phosphotransferase, partial [Deltaproteobacteria bacterium]|nr:phosphotransferase [Deltaproteobacteria bacterium]